MTPTHHKDLGSDLMVQIARTHGLSQGIGNVLGVLMSLPLASADDIAGVMNRPRFGVHQDLGKLKGKELVESAELGCTRGQRQRWYLTDGCLERAGLSGATWHDEQARRRLLELLPAVDQLYQALGLVNDLGRFLEFRWLDATGGQGPSSDAAALYEGGWVPLFWFGTLLSEADMVQRLTRFPVDCQVLAVGDDQPWPSRLCLVVMDHWERELTLRALEDCGMDNMASVLCVADGTITGPDGFVQSRGWVYQPVKHRADRGTWAGSLAASPWAGAGGFERWRVLEAVIQWPGAHLRFLKAVCGESSGSNRVRDILHQLVRSGRVLQHGEGRNARYFATGSGLGLRAGQDRVHVSDARTRSGLSQWQEARQRILGHTASKPHEDGLRELLRPFLDAGCPVANGVRCTEHLGAEGGIAPDAIIDFQTSPWGRCPAYLEYERSARGRAEACRKLRGYGAGGRRDRYPVILVCWDAPAEMEFQALARELKIQLVTTTLARLHDHGPVGNDRCWSLFGQPVELG